jgi:hypothetical protein
MFIHREALGNCELFLYLNDSCIMFLLRSLSTKLFLPGDDIIFIGVPSTSLFIVAAGIVSLRVPVSKARGLDDEDGGGGAGAGDSESAEGQGEEFLELDVLTEGALVGEESLLFGSLCRKSARASEYVTCLCLSKSDFKSGTFLYPELKELLTDIVGRRRDHDDVLLAERGMLLDSVTGRVARDSHKEFTQVNGAGQPTDSGTALELEEGGASSDVSSVMPLPSESTMPLPSEPMLSLPSETPVRKEPTAAAKVNSTTTVNGTFQEDDDMYNGQSINDIFANADTDSSGGIDVSQFHAMLETLNMPMDRNGSEHLFDQIDIDKSGAISESELRSFLALAAPKSGSGGGDIGASSQEMAALTRSVEAMLSADAQIKEDLGMLTAQQKSSFAGLSAMQAENAEMMKQSDQHNADLGALTQQIAALAASVMHLTSDVADMKNELLEK